MQSNKQIDYIQALRGLAALSVMVCHSRFNLHGTNLESAAETFMRPAAMGVDLFFLVSGFIMVLTTAKTRGSPRDVIFFLIKRFSRIWPVYAVIVIFEMMLAMALLPGALNWAHIFESLAFLPVDPRKPPYFDLPFAVGWTLNFEVYFYLVFGLSMLAKSLRWPAFFGWILISLVAIPFIHTGSVSLDPRHDYAMGIGYLDQITNPIIWDFVIGVLVGMFYTSNYQFPSRLLALLGIGGSGILVVWWASPRNADFHGIIGWGGPLALAFAFMACAFKEHPPKIHRSLLWLGEVSFSLYLVHLIAFDAMSGIVSHLIPLSKASPLFFAAEFSLALLFAAISNRFLENGLSKVVRQASLRLASRLLPAREGAYPGAGKPSATVMGSEL